MLRRDSDPQSSEHDASSRIADQSDLDQQRAHLAEAVKAAAFRVEERRPLRIGRVPP